MPRKSVSGFAEAGAAMAQQLDDNDLLNLFSAIGHVVSKRFLMKRPCLDRWQLVIDYLMSQQDRFGNIHAIEYYYFPKAGGGIDKVKKSKVDDGETPMPAGAVLVKKMILKDNDCGGPLKTNVIKGAGLLDQIRHMNASTYKHLRWLASSFAPGTEAPKFFVSEALFGQKDIDMLRANLATASQKLHDACASGKLLLDLDLGDHVAGRGHDPAACEASGPPGQTSSN